MKKFFASIPNRIKAIYLTWVSIHLTLFLLSENFLFNQGRWTSGFFPLRAGWENNFFYLESYDITEFIFYLTIPVIFYFIIKLWKKKDG
jgi:hypothetical protein